ncbi:hypothetical protein LX36DRAFT_329748 [Colletotrichum falcatum]|nr:hypothetical protein LX36DRAFT_329748 [Colletotrichum falcatum]
MACNVSVRLVAAFCIRPKSEPRCLIRWAFRRMLPTILSPWTVRTDGIPELCGRKACCCRDCEMKYRQNLHAACSLSPLPSARPRVTCEGRAGGHVLLDGDYPISRGRRTESLSVGLLRASSLAEKTWAGPFSSKRHVWTFSLSIFLRGFAKSKLGFVRVGGGEEEEEEGDEGAAPRDRRIPPHLLKERISGQDDPGDRPRACPREPHHTPSASINALRPVCRFRRRGLESRENRPVFLLVRDSRRRRVEGGKAKRGAATRRFRKQPE